MSRAQLTSTDQQNSGGAVAPAVAGKNLVINGDFGIWARGTSFIGTAYNFGADRWLGYRSAYAAGMTFSQSTSVPTGFKYGLKVQRDSGNTGTGDLIIRQGFETQASLPFANQVVTLSFYAKAGANYSPTSSILISRIYTGTGTDQATNNMTGWTGVTTFNQNNTLTTSFQRFTQTITIPSGATQVGIEFDAQPTGTAGADDSYTVTGVQLERGSVATPFTTASGTLQGELALCQRYGLLIISGNNTLVGAGRIYTSSIASVYVSFPTAMRTSPTLVSTSGSNYYDFQSSVDSYSNSVFGNAQTNRGMAIQSNSLSSAPAGNGCLLYGLNASAYLFADAEL